MTKKCLYTTLISISVVFLILCTGALFIFSKIDYFIGEQVKKQAPFLNSSKPFQKWSNPDSDTTLRFNIYVFNVTNVEGIKKGEKPRVQEVGPYEFMQKKKYHVYNWESNETLLNYQVDRSFFRDETCKGNLNDTVTILNVPLMSFANLIRMKTQDANLIGEFAIYEFMKYRMYKNDMFVTHKVGELLFDGYQDHLTKNLAKMENFLKEIKKYLPIKIDSGPPAISEDGYFSLLGQKNNSNFGLTTINMGKDNLTEIGRVVYLNGKKNVTCWKGTCSSLHGTDGLVHHPFIENTDILPVFEPELNRTVYLSYEKDTQYKGIPVKRFLLPENTFAAPKHNPSNECFCPFNDTQIQDKDGTLRVSHCNYDVPIVFSNPHFYQADKSFSDEISGFKPVKEKHESFADISKELGMVLNGRKTIQLNFDTEAYEYFKGTNKRRIFPVFWLSDIGSAGPKAVSELKEELYDKVENIKKYLVIFTAIFIAGFIVPLIYVVVECTLLWNTVGDKECIMDNNNEYLESSDDMLNYMETEGEANEERRTEQIQQSNSNQFEPSTTVNV